MLIIVIPEDFRNDQYILNPLFKQLIRSMGKQNARVEVCQQPRLGGINNAMKPERIQEIVERFDWRRDVVLFSALTETAFWNAVRGSTKLKMSSIKTDGVFLRKTLGRKLRHGFLRA